MKLYISSDIEGVCGIAAWSESEQDKGGRWYDYFCRQMTREVAAACAGALAAGARDILVKDAHDTARNIIPSDLPHGVRINRGWNGHPYSMVAGLQEGFDALAFTGYHSPAAGSGNPLAHTMSTEVDQVTINGQRASEFVIHSYVAGLLGVPVVFLSGDAALCRQARDFLPGITVVETGRGEGDASTSPHPDLVVQQMHDGMERALKKGFEGCFVPLPEWFEVEVRYGAHAKAYRNSFYPGAKLLDEKTIGFESADYDDVMQFFLFAL